MLRSFYVDTNGIYVGYRCLPLFLLYNDCRISDTLFVAYSAENWDGYDGVEGWHRFVSIANRILRW